MSSVTVAPKPLKLTADAISAATPLARNRAIDAYRAGAMVAVALGHWLASDVRTVDGRIAGSNALDRAPHLHALTWVFQVMPLFFCIGGYSNAASLDAHRRAGRTDGSWVRARLVRLSAPSSWLAGTWLVVLLAATALGHVSVARTALAVAAIPLWFLANYVIDTALAPRTLTLFRNHGMRFVVPLLLVFSCGEVARFFDVRFVPQVNIVIGWLLFQVLGFAWKDGRLPEPRRLLVLGTAAWLIAGSLVAFGPWPLAMVSVPGAQFANTWPPSFALLAYGLGSCSFAIAAAPTVDGFLRRRARAWAAVVAANTVTMTSYLWHFTALAVAALGLSSIDMLPTAEIGSIAWFFEKLPLMGAAAIVLVGIIVALAPKERRGLVGDSSAGSTIRPSRLSPAALAFVLAASFELWTASRGNLLLALPGIVGILCTHMVLRTRA